ncbi:MAG TPA: hypothetical protein VMU04_05730 [Candidatus Acidoferrum sp.]|nr:hypothetical protein [Candidatus Acidoferrum sp.]
MRRSGFLGYRYNRHSQFGEDGIIEEICRRLGINEGWFAEFGAWDGKHFSNTYNLLANKGWRGVMIECDPEKYKALLKTKASFPDRLHTLCAMVGFQGDSRLDCLLAKTPVPRNLDLLSIDIDSYDWQVWSALVEYEPRIVVIESNSLIPPGIHQVHNPPVSVGASFTALVELGKSKGYQIVCHTANCFFIRNELVPCLHLEPELLASPERLFNYPRHYRERLIEVGRRLLPEHFMHFLFGLSQRLKAARRGG